MERFPVFVIALVLVQQAIASEIQSRVCPTNEVYTECGSQCPRTCDNYKEGPGVCILSCFVGCQCIDGYVRNTADGTCCLTSECPVKPDEICPSNEVFNECGTACPLTCDNYKNPPKFCTDNCVTGCACEAGFVRNTATGACVLKSECPAQQPLCPLNQVYNTCGTACPLTCENYKSPPRACTKQCVIGCQCKKGYVKRKDGSCCFPEQCVQSVPCPQ